MESRRQGETQLKPQDLHGVVPVSGFFNVDRTASSLPSSAERGSLCPHRRLPRLHTLNRRSGVSGPTSGSHISLHPSWRRTGHEKLF